MSGNTGIRGYIIQTIICMIDALKADNDWLSVTLEPLDESEKVDIKWKYSDNVIKLTQVKSSENAIGYSAAKKWIEELKSNSPNASQYELILIGPLSNNLIKVCEIAGANITSIGALNAEILIDQASTKIDHYYTDKNKPKISAKVRDIIVHTLISRFATSSIVGREISRSDFDCNLMDWISQIENQIETNIFANLAPPIENQNIPINHRIVKKIMELIGWNQFGENYSKESFNEFTNETECHTVNFAGDMESKLVDDTGDFILISSIHDYSYPTSSKLKIVKYLNDTNIIYEDFKDKNEIPLSRFENTNNYSLLFWLTTDSDDIHYDFIHSTKENYRRNLLHENINYFLIDNKKANFLISSIITAKNYREEIPVKFLYPITEANQSPDKIGQRGYKLPVQYINSSVIPIAKEDSSKISFLLFCSDPFSSESLKKLIWLTIKLTSGFGNEYLLYFPDYDENLNKNEALKVIRSFNEDLLDNKIRVLKYHQVKSESLTNLPLDKALIKKDETYIMGDEKSLSSSKHLNEAFLNILPYGDILKPLLKTEAITANDIKIFLAKKGIFIKNADKINLINLMSSILFSPSELEDFKSLIDVKDRPVHSTNEHYRIKQNDTIENIFSKVKPNFDNLTEGLDAKIVDSDLRFKQNPDNKKEYKLSLTTEIKDPTNSLILNTIWGKAEIVVRKDEDRLLIATQNTITKTDKIIANRALKKLHEELNNADFIEEERIKVMFKKFKSNLERVNFLLSFSNVSSSIVLKEPDIRSIKFKFDENTKIPERYLDKADKDLVINFEGKGLKTLTELSVENAKSSIFLEEIKVLYKFDFLNIKNGHYKVTYNFSDALKNKGEIDGVFKSEPFLVKTSQVKKMSSIKNLEIKLSEEVEKLKIEKLKLFNLIS